MSAGHSVADGGSSLVTNNRTADSEKFNNVTSNAASSSLGVPSSRLRARSKSPDTRSLLSSTTDVDIHEYDAERIRHHELHKSGEVIHSHKDGWRKRLDAYWLRNKGVILVLLAQVFGVLMNVSTRLLETSPDGYEPMHPIQILFARMGITGVLATLYMWWAKVPDFPFGAKSVRPLLVARGIAGFFGVFGLYWALQYLPLADVTVIGFLAPLLSCYACSLILAEPFTRMEQFACFISIGGVILVAQPGAIFQSPSAEVGNAPSAPHLLPRAEAVPEATAAQRLQAVGMTLVSVMGATVAYTTIRWIGNQAHSLLSVNYFAVCSSLIATIALIFAPGIVFMLPRTSREWFLLVSLGAMGFILQLMLTAGLQHEKSSRATNMLYTSMLFALVFDWLVWGIVPNWISVMGSTLILGAAFTVAVQKARVQPKREDGAKKDEEVGLVSDMEGGESAVPMEELSRDGIR